MLAIELVVVHPVSYRALRLYGDVTNP